MVNDFRLVRPKTLPEALGLLDEFGQEIEPVAGGTDLLVKLEDWRIRPSQVMDLSALNELKQIRLVGEDLHLGALVTHTAVLESPLTRTEAPLLVMGCRTVGSTQIRNMGTLGGNLATASPAGDSIPALVALEAKVVLASKKGERTLPVEDFLVGPGKTERRREELIKEIILPCAREGEKGFYNKLGQRNALAISIANVAVWVRLGERKNTLSRVRIAFGALAPTVKRGRMVEDALTDRELDEASLKGITQLAWKEVAPITDIRASAQYRRDMAIALLYQSLYHILFLS